ncbi:MAG: hypothetical protein AB1609_00150 [Bacillota bacterium]
MTADELWERYSELSSDEPLTLEEFLAMAVSGRFGERPEPDTIERFLRRVEGLILANIETKLEESPQFHAMRDDAVERTQAMIAGLLARYAKGPADPNRGGAAAPPGGGGQAG